MNLADDVFIMGAILPETRGYVFDVLTIEHRNTFGRLSQP
jgi:hypothetical protein